jgi:heavy metal translocating P-type ATPase
MDRARPGSIMLPVAAGVSLLAGGVLWLWPDTRALGVRTWQVSLIVTGAPLVWQTLLGIFARRFAADIVAALSIIGAVLLGQPLAGLIIVLMQSGGEALEQYAAGRASAAVRDLEAAAPRQAHRLTGDHADDVSVDLVVVGDLLLIRPGDLVPCDGVVVHGRSHVDTARLTGEPLPITAEEGTRLMSGSTNGEGPLTIRATAVARESQYARIVDLVRSAQASKAPLQRLADRYAIWFTPFTLVACVAVYGVTRDPVRVLAVLVVATPCPLILAAPVAIIGGINRAARRQIIVRHGGALEQLANVDIAVFDKTGTLTIGQPTVSRVIAAPHRDAMAVLGFAASIENGSSHALARTISIAAEERAVPIPVADDVVEVPGRGVTGLVDGHHVTVGSRAFVTERHPGTTQDFGALDSGESALRAYVVIDGGAAGYIEFADQLRPSATDVVAELRRLGIERTVLLSGDQERYTQDIAAAAGMREAHGALLPADKERIVRQLGRDGDHVLMIGDGTNDAPALSSAAVGIAMGGHGGGITAEAADVVLLVDDITRVVDAIRIGRRTVRIAKESIWAGLALSASAMVCAAFGLIPPAVGAALQEGIDVAVIVNALRASAKPAQDRAH